MCRSAPPRISAVDRLLLMGDEEQQPLLPFENTPMINQWQQEEGVPWDQGSTEEEYDDDIQNNSEHTTTTAVMSPPPVGADYYYHDDRDFEADEVRYYHTGEEFDPEEEDRQLEVWRGLTRPRDNDDWSNIFARFSEQLALITGVQQPFREWESAWDGLM
jgi:hypothetical protein